MHNNSVRQLRENLRKSSRRQFLQQKFAQKRKQIVLQTEQINQQMFIRVINLFEEEGANYFIIFQHNKELLKFFSYSEQYSYRMLNLSFVIYQNFLKNPSDQSTLQILKNICFYQQVQIPQTQQFAHVLMEQFFYKYLQIGELLFYLTKNCKYGLFCARLVDNEIISVLGETLSNCRIKYLQLNKKQTVFTQFNQKQSLNYLIFQILSILSSLFTLQPVLNLDELQKIADILNMDDQKSLNQYYMFFISNIFYKVSKDFQPQKEIAQIIMNKFQRVITDIYKYEEQQETFLGIIDYCWKSQIFIPTEVIKLVVQGLKGSLFKNKVKLISILLKFTQISQDLMEIQSTLNFNLSSIPSLLQFNSMFQTKNIKKNSPIQQQNQKRLLQQLLTQDQFNQNLNICYLSQDNRFKQLILKLVQRLIQQLLTNQVFKDRAMNILKSIYSAQQFQNLLQESLDQNNISQTQLALNIISSIICYMAEESEQDLIDFKNMMQSRGMVKIIQSLINCQNSKCLVFQSQKILGLLYH